MSDPKKLIQLYIDGELDEQDRLRAEQILQEDPEARAEVENSRKLRAALQSAASPSSEISQSDFMWSRVKESIERAEAAPRPERNPWWNWNYRWAFSGFAALVVVTLAVSYLSWARRTQVVNLPDDRKQGYSAVTVYTFDPDVYPAEYRSRNAEANVIWITGADAYEPAAGQT